MKVFNMKILNSDLRYIVYQLASIIIVKFSIVMGHASLYV